jgi:hypothetical protein
VYSGAHTPPGPLTVTPEYASLIVSSSSRDTRRYRVVPILTLAISTSVVSSTSYAPVPATTVPTVVVAPRYCESATIIRCASLTADSICGCGPSKTVCSR